MFNIAGAGNDNIVIPALGSVTLRFAEPASPDQIVGHARLDTRSLLASLIAEAFPDQDWGIPLAGGVKLIDSTIGCIKNIGTMATSLAAANLDELATSMASFSTCLAGIVDAEIRNLTLDVNQERRVIQADKAGLYRRLKAASGVLTAYQNVKHAIQYVQRGADALLDQRGSIANSADVTIDLRPPVPQITFAGYGPLKIGMTRKQAIAASPLPLAEHGMNADCIFLTSPRRQDGSPALLVSLNQAGHVVQISAPPGARTDRGTGVGDTEDQVKAKYRSFPFSEEGTELGYVLAVKGPGDDHYLGFVLDNAGGGRVTNIVVGHAATVNNAGESCPG
jgi:hypothetical protein